VQDLSAVLMSCSMHAHVLMVVSANDHYSGLRLEATKISVSLEICNIKPFRMYASFSPAHTVLYQYRVCMHAFAAALA